MSVVVRHLPQSLTREQYDDVSRRMEDGGDWPPEGLDMHVMFGPEGDMHVSEIWDSEEQFRASFGRLERVLDEVGVRYTEPQVFEVHELEKRPEAANA